MDSENKVNHIEIAKKWCESRSIKPGCRKYIFSDLYYYFWTGNPGETDSPLPWYVCRILGISGIYCTEEDAYYCLGMRLAQLRELLKD